MAIHAEQILNQSPLNSSYHVFGVVTQGLLLRMWIVISPEDQDRRWTGNICVYDLSNRHRRKLAVPSEPLVGRVVFFGLRLSAILIVHAQDSISSR